MAELSIGALSISGASSTSSASAPDLSALGFDLGEPVPWEGETVELSHDGAPLRGVVVPLRGSGVLLYVASTPVLDRAR